MHVTPPATSSPATTDDVPCPLCAYNLRGLTEPRCPECGYRFEWPELLDPARRPHPYLFEHHPQRNVRSFLRTYVAGLRPRRFWRTLQPIHPIRARRLAAYFAVATSLLVLTIAAIFGWLYAQQVRLEYDAREFNRAYFKARPNDPNVQDIVRRAGSVDAHYDQLPSPFMAWSVTKRALDQAPFDPQSSRVIVVILLWPWLTLAALMIFRASMRRAKVRTGHVVRCTLYACDWALWLGSIAILFVTTSFAEDWLPIFYPPAAVPILAAGLFATYTTYRLGSAYGLYLHFHRPYATVAAAQVIVFLFVAAVAVMTTG